MRRRVVFAAGVLGALALAGPGGAQAPGCQVTSGADTPGTPGTLRAAVRAAADGATVRLCEGIVVGLREPLEIDADGVTLTGGAITHAGGVADPVSIVTRGSGVTLKGLQLNGVQVELAARGGALLGSTVVMTGSDRLRAAVVVGATDARVGTKAEPNAIATEGDSAIRTENAHRTTVAGNAVKVGGEGVDLLDVGSSRLHVEDNRFSRAVLVESETAFLERNQLGAAAAAAQKKRRRPALEAPAGILVARASGGGQVILRQNTVVRGTINVRRDRVLVEKGSVADSPGRGITIAGDRVTVRDVEVSGAGGAGIDVAKGVERAAIVKGSVRGSRGAGVLVREGARVRVSQVQMGANGGAGIDVAPAGATSNKARKLANLGIDFPEPKDYDESRKAVIGHACRGCAVEVFLRDGDEGGRYDGAVKASSKTGRFKVAAVSCGEAQALTFTATRDGEATSEFTAPRDLDCPIQERTVYAKMISNCGSGERREHIGDDRVVKNIAPGTTTIVQTWWFDDVCGSQTWTLIERTPKGDVDLRFKPIFPPYTSWDLDSSRCAKGFDPGCAGDFRLDLKLTNSEPDDD